MIDRDAFQKRFDVPRETMVLLDSYTALLADWQTRMNLVGPSTIPHVWHRHFADSAQLLALSGHGKSWLDIGAGAGFPGIVIALLDPAARVVLVESIAKKCRFLRQVIESLELSDRILVENRRIETLPRQKFDIITARALASLEQLLEWALPYAGSGTRWLLPKGARAAYEIKTARGRFDFDFDLVPSITEPEARVIVAKGVARR